MSEEPSDGELIAALQEGDVLALETLYDRYRVLAYSLALRVLRDPGEAEDVVQEAFLNVWRSSGTFRLERSTPRSWILSVVHHRAIDKLRGRQSRPVAVEFPAGMPLSDGTDVWADVAARMTQEDVAGALGRLPGEQREAIELAYFGGYSQTEIAEMTGAPLGTVKGRMRMGLRKLKGLLQSSRSDTVVE